jgi:hypothetical protein
MRYGQRTILRADRAVRCAPFGLGLYLSTIDHSVDLSSIAGDVGVQRGYTRYPLSELQVENELLWLMDVGLLRREVDGQGLTNSFRITPLGRQLVEQWQQAGVREFSAKWRDHLYNALSRWLRLPT